jgi:hypothetical protein
MSKQEEQNLNFGVVAFALQWYLTTSTRLMNWHVTTAA